RGKRTAAVVGAGGLGGPHWDGAQRVALVESPADLLGCEETQEPRAAARAAGAEAGVETRRDEPRDESGRTVRERSLGAERSVGELVDDHRDLEADDLLRVVEESLAARDRQLQTELPGQFQGRGDG